MSIDYKHLNVFDRLQIAPLRGQGLSIRAVAEILGRPVESEGRAWKPVNPSYPVRRGMRRTLGSIPRHRSAPTGWGLGNSALATGMALALEPLLAGQAAEVATWSARTGPAPTEEASGARLQASPNPFNPRTTLHLRLDAPSRVRMTVYDTRGRRVATLLDEPRPAGELVLPWEATDRDGSALASGVYYVRVLTDQFTDTLPLALVR